ncbi:MAG: hypothetical protein HYV34_03045, partial [Candidatus Kerfeldbacteria bacterium]|nr:hypothetical protein [Candidatus Kerfeldbacteria bacterium]
MALIENFSAPCMECGNCALSDFLILARNVSLLLLELTAASLVLMTMLSGLAMILSRGDQTWVDRAKSILRGAVIGVVVSLTAWLLVSTEILFLAGPNEEITKSWFKITPPNPNACYVPPPPADTIPGTTSPVTPGDWILRGIRSEQKQDASPELTSLINCIYEEIPNLGINSISDDDIYTGKCKLSDCSGASFPSCPISACENDRKCVHRCGSCHYGNGTQGGTGFSYAVDVATNVDLAKLKDVVNRCNPNYSAAFHDSPPHYHIENHT